MTTIECPIRACDEAFTTDDDAGMFEHLLGGHTSAQMVATIALLQLKLVTAQSLMDPELWARVEEAA